MPAILSSPGSPVAVDHPLPVRASATAGALGLAAGFLVLAYLATQFIKAALGHDWLYGLVPLFDLDGEKTVPAFFSTCLLLGATVLLAGIAHLKRQARAPYAGRWLLLAGVFLLLTVDEAAGLHELLSRPAHELLGTRLGGLGPVAWIVPALALVLTLGLAYLRFWWNLPTKTRWRILAAALVYVGGAAGLECAGGCYGQVHGMDNWTYRLCVAVEEGLEMTGMILFIYTLLQYIEGQYGRVQLRFGPG